jgi:hypothetical protein
MTPVYCSDFANAQCWHRDSMTYGSFAPNCELFGPVTARESGFSALSLYSPRFAAHFEHTPLFCRTVQHLGVRNRSSCELDRHLYPCNNPPSNQRHSDFRHCQFLLSVITPDKTGKPRLTSNSYKR